MGDGEPTTLDMQPRCAAGIDHSRRIQHLETSDIKQWEVIEKIRNRLPHWATLLISLLVGAIGLLFGLIQAR